MSLETIENFVSYKKIKNKKKLGNWEWWVERLRGGERE